MDIIGVIDLRGGRAVHAVAGERQRYLPVASAAGVAIGGDAVALGRTYVEQLGVGALYVADLDAIVDGHPPDATIWGIASCGVPLWVDAGVTSVDMSHHVVASGATQLVVGLETLPSWAALGEIVGAIGADRVVFSLDVRHGAALGTLAPDADVATIAARADAAGVTTIVVLDLARVGGGAGPAVDLVGRVREAAPRVRLVAGGGVRGVGDLERLAAAGCDAALVATALHDGRLDAAAVAAARAMPHRSVSR